ncbi:MAG: glutathione S-transferase family protein [Chromatiales bacterium]|nr:glutathione S-transferase family protein [Chromatiales bacterium]
MIGDQLRTRMVLHGHPKCMDTAKCLQMAAEKGVDIEAKVIDIDGGGMDSSDVRTLSPLGVAPILKDIDFVVYGTGAALSYLDDKGFGPSLVPRNGVVRAIMYQWCGVASNEAQPKIAADDITGLDEILSQLNTQITNPPKKGDYICGDFSMADIHWSACVNMLMIKGHGDLVSQQGKVQEWFNKVKQHSSTSKENIIPYTTVPTSEDIQNGKLRDISINV